MGGVRESLFCCLSNKADHCKNTGRGYRNAFWLIECTGLLENGGCEDGEWSGWLEILKSYVFTTDLNVY